MQKFVDHADRICRSVSTLAIFRYLNPSSIYQYISMIVTCARCGFFYYNLLRACCDPWREQSSSSWISIDFLLLCLVEYGSRFVFFICNCLLSLGSICGHLLPLSLKAYQRFLLYYISHRKWWCSELLPQLKHFKWNKALYCADLLGGNEFEPWVCSEFDCVH